MQVQRFVLLSLEHVITAMQDLPLSDSGICKSPCVMVLL